MSAIISVEHLSKVYRLGAIGGATFKDDFSRWWARSLGRSDPLQKHGEDGRAVPGGGEFLALDDVSFSLEEGDLLGIIGRNGAGKSTLLKILAQVTSPSSGEVKIRGRIASLLEVGTGFHPDLSGRENIFLNGAILGMTKAEIRRNFDGIVDFSGVEKFLDSPVKRYSSGMYVRLAFAVAAYLESEILIVDEVLAVGDTQFQKKCLGKMSDLAKSGRTVLFVSHHMAAIANLCRRGVFLRDGEVQCFGTQTEAITQYLASTGPPQGSLGERADRTGSGAMRLTGLEITDRNATPLAAVSSGQDVAIRLQFATEPSRRLSNVVAGILVTTPHDVPVFLQHNKLSGDDFGALPATGTFVCEIPNLPLPPGTYHLSCSLMIGDDYLDMVTDAGELTVIDGDFFGTGMIAPATHGACLVAARWRLEA